MREVWLSVLLLTACKGASPGSAQCSGNNDCAGGEICFDENCRRVCQSDAECAGDICQNNVCMPGDRNDKPLVSEIIADGDSDGAAGHFANRIERRLTLIGTNFDGAQVTLTSSTTQHVLDICSASSTELVVALPDGLMPGDYTLSVASQAGSCDNTLPILEGPIGPPGPEGPPGLPCASCVTSAEVADDSLTGADIAASAQLSVASIATSGDITVGGRVLGPLGDTATNPATSCATLHTSRPSAPDGIYWLQPASAAQPFRAYCDMTRDGGGWTLVWSNLRGGRGKPVTELQWAAAINTLPRYSGEITANLEGFSVYTGLVHWPELAPNNLLRHDWANDYGSAIDQSYRCTFGFTLPNYVLGLISCAQLAGAVAPGLFTYSNNKAFSTYDRDNDTYAGNCASSYSNSPWWYDYCFSGNMSGGGEFSSGYNNGAYWTGSTTSWGVDGGTGAGNGWIFVK